MLNLQFSVKVELSKWMIKKLCLAFLILSLCFLTTWYVYAFLLQPQVLKIPEEPEIVGNFMLALNVYNVNDLYAWQAVISYDPSELKVLNITPGGFLGAECLPINGDEFKGDSVFLKNVFPNKGIIVIGGSMLGRACGKSGSGTLAYITFGYFNITYNFPTIVLNESHLKTILLDSNSSTIRLNDSITLILSKID